MDFAPLTRCHGTIGAGKDIPTEMLLANITAKASELGSLYLLPTPLVTA